MLECASCTEIAGTDAAAATVATWHTKSIIKHIRCCMTKDRVQTD
jgi:hypothetical protein